MNKQIYFITTLLMAGFASAVAQNNTPPPAPRPLPPPSQSSTQPVQGTGRIGVGSAQSQPSADTPSTQSQTGDTKFNTGVDLRDRSSSFHPGWSLGLFGGASVFMDGTDTGSTIGGAALVGDNSNSEAFASGGIKIGYTWPFYTPPGEKIDQFDAETNPHGVFISGGLEFETFYTGLKMSPNVAGGRVNMDMHNGVFALNALIKFQMQQFQVYMGPGAGGAISYLEDVSVPGTGRFRGDDDFNFAYQVLAGAEYMILPESQWSLFAEYRYLVLDNVEFHSGSATNLGDIEAHHVNLGIRKHF